LLLVDNLPAVLPVAVFIVCMILSFGLGTSWGTVAIITPIALPLAFATTGGQLNWIVYATVSSVLSGSIFGDHYSLISDTTIISSTFAGSDHMDHVTTQIPYAVFAAVIAIIGYFLMLIGLHWAIILPLDVVALYFGTIWLNKRSAKKYGIPEIRQDFKE
jgi:Na+/H+ antiporter NhaC